MKDNGHRLGIGLLEHDDHGVSRQAGNEGGLGFALQSRIQLFDAHAEAQM